MWLFNALKPTYNYLDQVEIAWTGIWIEIGLFSLLIGVLCLATYFRSRACLRYIGAVCGPILVGMLALIPAWIRGHLFLDYRVLLSIDGYLMVGLITGIISLRKRTPDRLTLQRQGSMEGSDVDDVHEVQGVETPR
ncbi:MAG: hypothetical protein JWL77_814 [Chthonomonadaceae bacterium]|nr:hypothetical protein [Chthonomonadaceae bacterium]